MISFDLKCSHDHVFEVWFRSSADYEAQRARSLILCPLCGDTGVTKAVMAPAVGLKGNRAVTGEPAGKQAGGQAVPGLVPSRADALVSAMATAAMPRELAEALATIARLQAEALPKSRWVGRAFAEEARALHGAGVDGQASGGAIHGQATAEEAEALIEDGIAVMPLLVPFVPPEAQN